MMEKRVSAIILGFLILFGRFYAIPVKSQNIMEAGKTDSPIKVSPIETIIDRAYQNCFRNIVIDGSVIEVRIPFAQKGERYSSQEIFHSGKAAPEKLWPEIFRLLRSESFRKYREIIQADGPKLIIFDLRYRKWVPIINETNIQVLKEMPYPGSREMIFIFKEDSILTIEDIYNYLYCVGSVGMDCSGFVYYIQKSIAEALGTDLEEVLAMRLNRKPENVSGAMGLPLYSDWPEEWEVVDDMIENLRPGDIFMFRGRNTRFRHSAVIQLIDREKGEIRYIQCTDWSTGDDRGVHKSHIFYNPENRELRLSDESVEWTQEVNPTFKGEPGLLYWKNDGDRYRSYRQYGGSIIIRSKFIKNLIEEKFPEFYSMKGEGD